MSRHVIASQARSLAAAGCNVMLLDLSGCGDSEGEFSQVSWETWLNDVNHVIEEMLARFGLPVSLWGLRMGSLLACHIAHERTDIQELQLWQPVLNGEQQIDQFLRLSTAAAALEGELVFDRKALWGELRAGRSLEVAGLELSSALALEMAGVRLGNLVPKCSVKWLHIGPTGANVASEKVMSSWRDQNVEVECLHVPAAPFWRTVDAPVDEALQQHWLQVVTA